MKNACVVLRSEKDVIADGWKAVVDAFCLNGYAFDEIRLLVVSEENRVVSALSSLKNEFDNVVVLSEKALLTTVKRYVSQAFPEGVYQGGVNGAGIYDNAKSTWFLLSDDVSDTGVSYAKNVCAPYLYKKCGVRAEKYVIRSVGGNETHLQRLIAEAKTFGGEKIACNYTRRYGEDVIEIAYDDKTPKMLIDDTVRLFADGLGESIYALENISLEEQLVRLLKLRGKKISVAESFTGGGIGRRIVSVSGASEVYFEGLNTYNEQSKMKRLGVSEYALKTMGAVSDQTAYEMATGLLNTKDCDIAIATTGLAGPKSDRSLLPIGLCFIAVGVKERVFVYRYKFDGTREEITETAINYALFLAYKQLKNI